MSTAISPAPVLSYTNFQGRLAVEVQKCIEHAPDVVFKFPEWRGFEAEGAKDKRMYFVRLTEAGVVRSIGKGGKKLVGPHPAVDCLRWPNDGEIPLGIDTSYSNDAIWYAIAQGHAVKGLKGATCGPLFTWGGTVVVPGDSKPAYPHVLGVRASSVQLTALTEAIGKHNRVQAPVVVAEDRRVFLPTGETAEQKASRQAGERERREDQKTKEVEEAATRRRAAAKRTAALFGKKKLMPLVTLSKVAKVGQGKPTAAVKAINVRDISESRTSLRQKKNDKTRAKRIARKIEKGDKK